MAGVVGGKNSTTPPLKVSVFFILIYVDSLIVTTLNLDFFKL